LTSIVIIREGGWFANPCLSNFTPTAVGGYPTFVGHVTSKAIKPHRIVVKHSALLGFGVLG